MSYYPPTFEASAFTCPHCNAYSQMEWRYWNAGFNQTYMKRAECVICRSPTYWFGSHDDELEGRLVYPLVSSVPMPHADMPDVVKNDYLEARDVLPHSSRAAAALIRLALQRLCIHLGKSSNINAVTFSLKSAAIRTGEFGPYRSR